MAVNHIVLKGVKLRDLPIGTQLIDRDQVLIDIWLN